MSAPSFVDTFTVAIEGFSAFERQSLASFFRLAAQRSPAFRQVEEPGMADFLIADADHPASVAAVRRGQRVEDAVFIGARAPDGAAAWLPRPIEPVHVMRALDELVELRLSAPEPPSTMMDLDPLDADTQRGDLDPVREPAQARVDFAAAPPRPRGGGGREVLLVEDSPIARHFLKQRLQHLGYRVLDCASGEAALEILSRRTFGLVFLDIVLGPPGSVDGLQLCQRLKQRGAKGGGLRTVVVVVTGLDGATDRVRGSLAGCDAYLTKPLHEGEFIATLLQVDPAFEWSADASSAAA